ncbi:SDR family NAD(P)-dependent oxidoreductase [Kytococcus sedentarius]|uniref:SDR family NAD(P)-dependent oxidoreductase n=1 Tax=Kytococcus sedentarius TaxID=1276 RepID=UPI00194EAD1A|nr:SDR family oxidoreductase [Kytococcus sedentarius]QRO87731.1 SDR family oxidoreductase [Kytococcus sedentarius]
MNQVAHTSHPMALVTGASSGIGKQFAEQLAAKGHGLVLVARDRERLEALAIHLGTHYGVPTEVLSADLTQRADIERVARRIRQDEAPVTVLVNNAGYGLGTGFLRSEIEDEEDALTVMVRAVMVLSQAAAQRMADRGAGVIINVSSVASLLPYGSYGAAKAWVTRFSEGLALDLHGTGVYVQALLPGLTHTEFHARSGEKFGGAPEWMWLPAEKVVRESLAAVGSGEVTCVPGLQYKAAMLVLPRLPRRVVLALVQRANERDRAARAARRAVTTRAEGPPQEHLEEPAGESLPSGA